MDNISYLAKKEKGIIEIVKAGSSFSFAIKKFNPEKAISNIKLK